MYLYISARSDGTIVSADFISGERLDSSSNAYSGQDFKQSIIEAGFLQIRGMWSNPSLQIDITYKLFTQKPYTYIYIYIYISIIWYWVTQICYETKQDQRIYIYIYIYIYICVCVCVFCVCVCGIKRSCWISFLTVLLSDFLTGTRSNFSWWRLHLSYEFKCLKKLIMFLFMLIFLEKAWIQSVLTAMSQ